MLWRALEFLFRLNLYIKLGEYRKIYENGLVWEIEKRFKGNLIRPPTKNIETKNNPKNIMSPKSR
jgi:hypothetical protein